MLVSCDKETKTFLMEISGGKSGRSFMHAQGERQENCK
jgi:hypothetical protein